MQTNYRDIFDALSDEIDKATEGHGPMTTFHEGIAVIQEKVDELWTEVKQKQLNRTLLRTEALQVAAMALRFIHDLIDESTDDNWQAVKHTRLYRAYHCNVVNECVRLMGENNRAFFDFECDYLEEFIEGTAPAAVAAAQQESI